MSLVVAASVVAALIQKLRWKQFAITTSQWLCLPPDGRGSAQRTLPTTSTTATQGFGVSSSHGWPPMGSVSPGWTLPAPWVLDTWRVWAASWGNRMAPYSARVLASDTGGAARLPNPADPGST